jgi:hypothetical protein
MTFIHILPESFHFRMDPQSMLERVILQIGYPQIPSDRKMKAMIQSIIQEGNEKIRVDFVYKETRIMSWEGHFVAADGIRIESLRWSELVRHIEAPEQVCCFVITLGSAFDQWIQKVQKKSMFDAFIADALGAVYIEFAADQLTLEIEGQYGRMGLECSRRLSPGYCDWGLVDGQKVIFQFVQTGHIGVSYMPSGLMVPLKTISAVILVGKKVSWKTPCVFCNDQTCRHRREERNY